MGKWEPEGLGKTIFKDRYARDQKETWQGGCRRVADHVAAAEENGKIKKYSDAFYEQLVSNKFNPGGRIWYGAGRPYAQLLNCFIFDNPGDSAEGWGQVTNDVIVVSSAMGGIGMNCSSIRPRGTPLKRKGGVATGAVSLMQLIDRVGDVLVGGGGRRMALMLCLDLDHPDLEEFLDVKLNLNELNNANISVVIPKHMDVKEFINKVENGGDIEFRFNGLPTGKKMNAKELWEKLVQNAWKSGEPGVLNSFTANHYNNVSYISPVLSTNPCGEIWGIPWDCCDLGHLVLPRFVDDSGEVDWDTLDETIRTGVRFLDNVLTVNHYPLEKIRETSENIRRVGLGVTGLHTMLLKMGMKYSSPEALAFCDKLGGFIKNTAYDASITLSVEKGPFPGYDPKYLEGNFVKGLKRGIKNKIRMHGIRNSSLLTIAPTGTISMVSDVSSGIEPYPAPVYWRHILKATDDGRRERIKELVVIKEYVDYPEIIEGAADLSPRNHFEMQRVWQNHVDQSVSKTINLPNDYPADELSNLWLEYLPTIKGSTFYRWQSREFEPISPIKKEDISQVLREHGGDIDYEGIEGFDPACPTGSCEVNYVGATSQSEG